MAGRVPGAGRPGCASGRRGQGRAGRLPGRGPGVALPSHGPVCGPSCQVPKPVLTGSSDRAEDAHTTRSTDGGAGEGPAHPSPTSEFWGAGRPSPLHLKGRVDVPWRPCPSRLPSSAGSRGAARSARREPRVQEGSAPGGVPPVHRPQARAQARRPPSWTGCHTTLTSSASWCPGASPSCSEPPERAARLPAGSGRGPPWDGGEGGAASVALLICGHSWAGTGARPVSSTDPPASA